LYHSTRDVKQSSKIRTSNPYSFSDPFDICSLTALCLMLRFIFDHACMDHSICIWSEGILL